MASVDGLVDPRVARLVARRLAGDADLKDSYLMHSLEADLEVAVPRAEALVAEASGIPAPPPVRWAVVDRAAWSEANIDGMTTLLGPLTAKVAGRMRDMPLAARAAQRAIVSAEVGVLLGYISRRVLGQYDVLVSDEPAVAKTRPGLGRRRRIAPGTVLYFVGPNMVETERRFGFVPQEFSLWVALHEVTHRFQFAGVPWLRDRFMGLVNAYFDSLELDTKRLVGRLAAAVSHLRDRSTPAEQRNPVYLMASPEQRGMLDDIQALMAVVEGHGNYVMDTVGAEVIPSFSRMRHLFQRRREQATVVQRAIGHLIGLEMKLRQYELGQSFCEQVVARGGDAALARLWTAPEAFPRLSELREPELWLHRTA